MKDFLAPDDTRDDLRKYGGLLLALGILMLLQRKGGDMSDFVLFLILAGTAVFFYGGGVLTDQFTGATRVWQGVFSVIGLIFVPLALFQLIELLDGSPSELNTFWIFGVTAALAFYAGIVKGIRFHLLAGSIAAIVAWSALWDKLLGDEGIAGHFGTYRGLLGILSIILLAGALYLWRQGGSANVEGTATDDGGDKGAWQASELITGAGISAVLATSLGITSVFTALGPLGFFEFTVVETSQVWDVLLLVISLGLVGLGALIGTRGPVYVGVIGLLFFLTIVGGDLNDETPEPDKLGIWPIILLLGGALALGLSGLKQASLGDGPRKSLENLRK